MEVPPPGPGLVTVKTAVLAAAISEAEIAAVNCEALMKVVDLALPFQFTTEPDEKLVPFIVSVNAVPLGATAAGTTGWLMKGTGLGFWPSTFKLRKRIAGQTEAATDIIFA